MRDYPYLEEILSSYLNEQHGQHYNMLMNVFENGYDIIFDIALYARTEKPCLFGVHQS